MYMINAFRAIKPKNIDGDVCHRLKKLDWKKQKKGNKEDCKFY